MSIATKILEKTKSVKSSQSEASTKFDSYVQADATNIVLTLNTHTGMNAKVSDLVSKHIKYDYKKADFESSYDKASKVAKTLEAKLGKEIEALEADFQKKVLQKIEAAAKEIGSAWK